MDEFSYQPQLLQTILGQPHHNTILITKKMYHNQYMYR